MAQRQDAIGTTILQIMEQIQRQDLFNEGVRASFTSLEEDVKKHNYNFREVARIFQAHEEYIAKTGAASQEMAQCINALTKENENKTAWISSLMRETREQTQVLRQHHLGLQVQAEVIKDIIAGQQQPQPQHCQTITAIGPTVTEIDEDDDEDRRDFLGGPSPYKGPPTSGSWQVTTKPPRTRKHKNAPKRR